MLFRLILLFIFVYYILLTSTIRENPYLYIYKTKIKDVVCTNHNNDTFNKVDNVCDDCFNLFRNINLYNDCRQNCFGSEYFPACLEVLLQLDEKQKHLEWVTQLHNGSTTNITWS
uniref:Venom peptide CNH-Rm n=1 Tax=Rhytidoponera metallica TaxID=148364 RepID=A0A8U0LTN7_RHYMT|nr:venom peptide precursor CNH-Rm [Rhytidoponera metallica]